MVAGLESPGCAAHRADARQAVRRAARGRRLALRAEVGRLPRARLPRRRRASTSRAATASRSTATSPSWRAAARARCPQRCVLDGEIVIAEPARARFRRAAAAHPPGGVARCKLLAQETPASFVAWDLLALGDEDLRARAARRAARAASRRRSAGARPPVHLTPATRDRARRARLVHALRGRRPRRRDRQARRPAPTSRASARW